MCIGNEGAVLIKCQSLTLSKPAKISFYRIERLVRIDTRDDDVMNMNGWKICKNVFSRSVLRSCSERWNKTRLIFTV